MYEMTLTLNSPITEEQMDAITDVDLEHTSDITFYTKHGKEVKFVKASAQPKKGKWILIRPDEDKAGNGLYECSECGKGDIHAPEVEVPFCWHCGARMVNEDE